MLRMLLLLGKMNPPTSSTQVYMEWEINENYVTTEFHVFKLWWFEWKRFLIDSDTWILGPNLEVLLVEVFEVHLC